MIPTVTHIQTSTPVIWTGIYPHMPIAITEPAVASLSRLSGQFVSPGYTAVQCIIDFSLFSLGG